MDNYLKHLRNIQILLLATCFALVATAWTSKQTVTDALDQLISLENSFPYWNSAPFYEEFENILMGYEHPSNWNLAILKVNVDADRLLISFEEKIAIPITIELTDDDYVLAIFNGLRKATQSLLPKPKNISELSAQWNKGSVANIS